jgi:hypothetical protein
MFELSFTDSLSPSEHIYNFLFNLSQLKTFAPAEAIGFVSIPIIVGSFSQASRIFW